MRHGDLVLALAVTVFLTGCSQLVSGQPLIGCDVDLDCAGATYCARPDGVCSKERGRCVFRPEVCPQVYEPVCGCNGQTYGNACQAAYSGENVTRAGACQTRRQ